MEPLLRQVTQHLAHEERVAAGVLLQGEGEGQTGLVQFVAGRLST